MNVCMLNSKNGKPILYQSIYEDLLKSIINGKYKIGDKFPTETYLQERYSVSRITIRRAMEMLQNDGYIVKSSGIGTVVSSNKRALQLEKLESFSKENYDYPVSSKLLLFKIEKILPKVAARLKLSLNSQVYMHERIRIVNDEIISFQRVYVPTGSLSLKKEDFIDSTSSLYELFAANGIEIESADEMIEAVVADGFLSKTLEVSYGSPLLYLERSTFDTNNRGIEFAEIYYRADRYQYKIHLDNN